MEKSFGAIVRKIRSTRSMSTAAGTFDANTSLADALRGIGAKVVAKIAQTTPRTVENWQAGANGPTWRATVAMLNDADLAPRLLAAAGRHDLARAAEIETLNRRIDALKSAEQRHKDEADEIRRDLAMGRQRGGLASGPTQQSGDPLEKDRGVVPGSTD